MIAKAKVHISIVSPPYLFNFVVKKMNKN